MFEDGTLKTWCISNILRLKRHKAGIAVLSEAHHNFLLSSNSNSLIMMNAQFGPQPPMAQRKYPRAPHSHRVLATCSRVPEKEQRPRSKSSPSTMPVLSMNEDTDALHCKLQRNAKSD